MKKFRFLTLLMAVLFLFSFASCAASNMDAEDGGFGNLSGNSGGVNIQNSVGSNLNPGFQDDAVEEGTSVGVAPDASDPDDEKDEAATGEGEDVMTGEEMTGAETEASDPDDEEIYTSLVDNPFIDTLTNPISTFSADVDTASYTYFRKLVNQGYTLNELKGGGSNFRIEEFINYFDYNVAQPKDNELFGVTTDMVKCPWNNENYLFRLTLQAENAQTTAGNNLVFLIDVSGSMSSQDKLPLLKKAFAYLVSSLGKNDRVSIVTYSGKEAVVLDGCVGSKGDMILSAINSLRANGSTNGEAGLTEAYRIAEKNYIEGGNNRIIMASDGDLNVGISSASELVKYIEDKRDQGVYLSVLGFGTGNYRDTNMEALADNGNGVYYYIDGESEAEKVFGSDLLGTLYTVAEDVKLQLVFNSEKIKSYRLIGYDNRLLSEENFNDDTKDAGEVGASHQITVCYEIKMTDNEIAVDPLITLKVRYKNPGESLSLLNEHQLGEGIMRDEADEDIRFLTSVVETCMILRGSAYAKDLTLADVLEDLRALDLDEHPEREEFKLLIEKLVTAE